MTEDSEVTLYEELFRANHRLLCSVAMRLVNNPEVAEDIVQEFFISLWLRRSDTPYPADFRAYACQAVRYKSISWLRKQSKFVTEAIEDFTLPEDPVQLNQEADEAEIRTLRMQALVDELPPARRKIFLLNASGDYTYKQIADQLNLSVNTVKSQLVKAYAFLREQLKK